MPSTSSAPSASVAALLEELTAQQSEIMESLHNLHREHERRRTAGSRSTGGERGGLHSRRVRIGRPRDVRDARDRRVAGSRGASSSTAGATQWATSTTSTARAPAIAPPFAAAAGNDEHGREHRSHPHPPSSECTTGVGAGTDEYPGGRHRDGDDGSHTCRHAHRGATRHRSDDVGAPPAGLEAATSVHRARLATLTPLAPPLASSVGQRACSREHVHSHGHPEAEGRCGHAAHEEPISHAISHAISSAVDSSPPSTSRPSTSRVCVICCEHEADAVLYRCGHRCACLRCAHYLRFERQPCPLCRAPIDDVIRVYE